MTARDAQWRDMTEAAGWWQRAVALAETNHLDREKAEAEARLGRVLNELGRHEDAHVWFELSSATLTRLGGDPSLSLMRDVYEGWAYRDEAKYADAVRVLEPAIERATAAHVGIPVPLSDAQSFLGLSLVFDPARFDDAIAHARAAVALTEDALGAHQLDVAAMLSNLAVVEMEAGHLEEALATASRCVAAFEAAVERREISAMTPNFGNALLNRGEVLLRLGRAEEAIASVERARGVYETNKKEDSILEADLVLAGAWTEAWTQQAGPANAARFARRVRVCARQTRTRRPMPPDLLVELFVVEAKFSRLHKARQVLALASRGEGACAGRDRRLVPVRSLERAPHPRARARERRAATPLERADWRKRLGLGLRR